MKPDVMHVSVSAFADRAASRLLQVPRMAGPDGFGDYAITGITMPPEKVALLRPAAVLIALNRETGGVIFTVRAQHLSKHPGQISFPGGRIERSDEGPLAAALREAEEEIGLPAAAIEPLGYLDEYFTGTGFRVTPVVALVQPFAPRLDANEVDVMFEAPIDLLMDLTQHEEHFRTFDGIRRRTYAVRHESHYIWGVTAGIIRRLQERVFG
jgi:8-oxo-dGTP pyrophosphatase MutT (NUDIX family)